MGKTEFIALMAMMFATIAFSVDAMLPGLPEIAAELGLGEASHAALIITFFMLGLGIGTFFTGPMSDAMGRRPVVFLGIGIYAVSALVAWRAQSMEVLLVARLVQGMGAAGPRVVSLAIMRDLYSGPEMARIMSFVLMVFLIFPAMAPAIGAQIIAISDWRFIFVVFAVFAAILATWFGLRVDETLPEKNRRPVRWRTIFTSIGEMFAHPIVRLSIAVQTLMMAALFAVLMLSQPIFVDTFSKVESFPYWFGAIALLSGTSSLLNAQLVRRFGMRRLITWAVVTQVIFSTCALLTIWQPSPWSFAIFVTWQFGVMFQAGMTVANLNALAMEPMGHIAGTAASVLGAVATIAGALAAVPLAFAFDGTPRPLIFSVLMIASIASYLMLEMRRAERQLAS